MSEHEHVLSLKEIEFEREVALKASLTGSIEYVRMARQIEAAVVAKLRTSRILNVVEGVTTTEADAIDREVAAFVACAAWMSTLTANPVMRTIKHEAARRYRPTPAPPEPEEPPTVTLSTGVWRRLTLGTGHGWQHRLHYSGIGPVPAEWRYNLSQPECRSAEDYNAVAEYLTETP
jgi:hypothetical protein